MPELPDLTVYVEALERHTRGATLERIRVAENETHYCARCQTGGKLLADRSLSRLLKKDWPKNLDEWEQRRSGMGGG